MDAYIAKVPPTPSAFTSDKNVNVTSSVPAHSVDVTSATARPRTLVGKISDMYSHTPGPMPNAKNATYTMTQASIITGDTLGTRKATTRAASDTPMPPL